MFEILLNDSGFMLIQCSASQEKYQHKAKQCFISGCIVVHWVTQQQESASTNQLYLKAKLPGWHIIF